MTAAQRMTKNFTARQSLTTSKQEPPSRCRQSRGVAGKQWKPGLLEPAHWRGCEVWSPQSLCLEGHRKISQSQNQDDELKEGERARGAQLEHSATARPRILQQEQQSHQNQEAPSFCGVSSTLCWCDLILCLLAKKKCGELY